MTWSHRGLRFLLGGLIEPAPAVGDPDFDSVLEGRSAAIQLRSETFVDRAIADFAPRLAHLGVPFSGHEADERRREIMVACYRDQRSPHRPKKERRNHWFQSLFVHQMRLTTQDPQPPMLGSPVKAGSRGAARRQRPER